MHFFTELVGSLHKQKGQASVEAALLLPVLLFIVGLLVQPACIFYTRSIMEATAAEGARLLATQSSQVTDEEITAFLKRRLKAIPALAIFHEGGEDAWKFEIEKNDTDKLCRVRIEGRVQPLPLLGAFSVALTNAPETPGAAATITVCAEESLQPQWLHGDYDAWVSAWGA